MTSFKIATRGSPLALWQAEAVKKQLEARHPALRVKLVRLKTKGDRILDTALANVGGKGLFVKELEDALLKGEADLAVHSMKDVPVDLPQGLMLGAITEREDPRDALVSTYAVTLEDLRLGARVGTSSLRRQAQLLEKRPDLEVVPVRGNVDSRLSRMRITYLDAIILAAAGLKRLGFEDRISRILSTEEMLPAIGQGALGLEIRQDDPRTLDLISFLNHPHTEIAVKAERAFLRRLEGDCQVPIAAKGTLRDGALDLTGFVSELDGSRAVRKSGSASPEDADNLGTSLAEAVLDDGGRDILTRFYSMTESL
ncbi:MAG: hydroxymethylbilane synthase [Deltaproteobacteria bacterium]|nr:hydroxymethylbilane synthase [Deltaproteobacteria bacterium]